MNFLPNIAMHLLHRKTFCLIALFVVTILGAYGADEATEAAIRAFSHDPGELTIHAYAGHRADMYAYSCDGRYLFTANDSEITVREYPSWHVVKTFPFHGTAELEAHPTRPDMFYFRPSKQIYPTRPSSAFMLADWKTGRILAHVERPPRLQQQMLRAVPEPLVSYKSASADLLQPGYLPRNPHTFSKYPLSGIGQGGAIPNQDDSYLLVTSMQPYMIDLKHARSKYYDVADWLLRNDRTLPREYPALVRMLPKPEKLALGNRSAYINRNHFEGVFIDTLQATFGSPSGCIFDWLINPADGGRVYPQPFARDTPLAVFSVAQYGSGSDYNDYKRVMATTDGVYFGPLYGPFHKLPEFKGIHTTGLRDMANVVAGPYGDGKFLVGMAAPRAANYPTLYSGSFRDSSLVASGDCRSWGEIVDIKISADETFALLTNGYSLRKADLTRNDTIMIQPKIRVPGCNGYNTIGSCAILPDGRLAAGVSTGGIYIYTPAKDKWEKLENVHNGKVISMKLSTNGARLYSSDENDRIIIWNAHTMERIVTVNMLYPFGFMAITPDNYYSIESYAPAASLINFAKDNRAYSYDQFDIIYNRPDIVAERLGGDPGYIALLHKAWLKRLRRAGLTPGHLAADFHTPEIEITDRGELATKVDSPEFRVSIKASDTRMPLKSLHLRHNGVSVFGEEGLTLAGAPRQHEEEFNVRLVPGTNHISLWAMNSEGATSRREEFTVSYLPSQPEPEPVLWVVAMGVSDYDNPAYRLRYAAKDARDFVNMLRTSCNSFSQVATMCITDKELTAGILPEIKNFLGKAGRNDAAVIFYAGHGVIDSELDYYLAPADMDFANPSRKGLPVSSLVGLLDQSLPLNRYLLIDACHSGSFDKEDYIADNTASLPAGGDILFRSVGGIRHNSEESRQAKILSDIFFRDTGDPYGITVLTASSGDEVALESDKWGNGLFTYLLKEGMSAESPNGEPRASIAGNVTFRSLADYVKNHAPRLSGDRQHPAITLSGTPELIIRHKTSPSKITGK